MSANIFKHIRKSLGNEALEQRIAELEHQTADLLQRVKTLEDRPKPGRPPKNRQPGTPSA